MGHAWQCLEIHGQGDSSSSLFSVLCLMGSAQALTSLLAGSSLSCLPSNLLSQANILKLPCLPPLCLHHTITCHYPAPSWTPWRPNLSALVGVRPSSNYRLSPVITLTRTTACYTYISKPPAHAIVALYDGLYGGRGGSSEAASKGRDAHGAVPRAAENAFMPPTTAFLPPTCTPTPTASVHGVPIPAAPRCGQALRPCSMAPRALFRTWFLLVGGGPRGISCWDQAGHTHTLHWEGHLPPHPAPPPSGPSSCLTGTDLLCLRPFHQLCLPIPLLSAACPSSLACPVNHILSPPCHCYLPTLFFTLHFAAILHTVACTAGHSFCALYTPFCLHLHTCPHPFTPFCTTPHFPTTPCHNICKQPPPSQFSLSVLLMGTFPFLILFWLQLLDQTDSAHLLLAASGSCLPSGLVTPFVCGTAGALLPTHTLA